MFARYRQIFDGIERRHADSLSAVEAQEAYRVTGSFVLHASSLHLKPMERRRRGPLRLGCSSFQVLQRSRLPNQELEAIWQLSDVDQAWWKGESLFLVALHLALTATLSTMSNGHPI